MMGINDDTGLRIDPAPEAEAVLEANDLAGRRPACQSQARTVNGAAGGGIRDEVICRIDHEPFTSTLSQNALMLAVSL